MQQSGNIPWRHLFGLIVLAAVPGIYFMGRSFAASVTEWNVQYFNTIFSMPGIVTIVILLVVSFWAPKGR